METTSPINAVELEPLVDESPLFRPDCKDCTFCDGLRDMGGEEKPAQRTVTASGEHCRPYGDGIRQLNFIMNSALSLVVFP